MTSKYGPERNKVLLTRRERVHSWVTTSGRRSSTDKLNVESIVGNRASGRGGRRWKPLPRKGEKWKGAKGSITKTRSIKHSEGVGKTEGGREKYEKREPLIPNVSV